MFRFKNFFTWLRSTSMMSGGSRNMEIAAHGASHFFPNHARVPDGGTVYSEAAPEFTEQAETPEERSRRLKRERDRRYKARKKAVAIGQASFA